MSTTVISTPISARAPAWAQTMRRWTDYFVKGLRRRAAAVEIRLGH